MFDGSDTGLGDVHHIATAEMPGLARKRIASPKTMNDIEMPDIYKTIDILLHDD